MGLCSDCKEWANIILEDDKMTAKIYYSAVTVDEDGVSESRGMKREQYETARDLKFIIDCWGHKALLDDYAGIVIPEWGDGAIFGDITDEQAEELVDEIEEHEKNS